MECIWLTNILAKHKLLIFILGLVLLAALLGLLLLKRDIEKIPSRGVFVIKTLADVPTMDMGKIL
jgi:hypothetical protein